MADSALCFESPLIYYLKAEAKKLLQHCKNKYFSLKLDDVVYFSAIFPTFSPAELSEHHSLLKIFGGRSASILIQNLSHLSRLECLILVKFVKRCFACSERRERLPAFVIDKIIAELNMATKDVKCGVLSLICKEILGNIPLNSNRYFALLAPQHPPLFRLLSYDVAEKERIAEWLALWLYRFSQLRQCILGRLCAETDESMIELVAHFYRNMHDSYICRFS